MRFEYTLNLASWAPSTAKPLAGRTVHKDDLEALATLLLAAYQGTIDDEGEGEAEAREFVQSFLSDSPILLCSRILEKDHIPAAACLVSVSKNTPLITTIITHPDWKNQGLAGQVLCACLQDLKQNGHASVTAWITEGNVPSERLLSRIGFQRIIR